MKAKECLSMKPEELDGKIKELKLELIKLYAQVVGGTTPKKPSQIKQIKKNIARMMTVKQGGVRKQ